MMNDGIFKLVPTPELGVPTSVVIEGEVPVVATSIANGPNTHSMVTESPWSAACSFSSLSAISLAERTPNFTRNMTDWHRN